jgi:hypothetical protein
MYLSLEDCLGAWLVLLGHWGDLGAFTRELARLKAKEMLHWPLQLLAFKLYLLFRLGKIYKISISRPYR